MTNFFQPLGKLFSNLFNNLLWLLSIAIIGGGVGVLSGISASPVISIILTGLITLSSTVLTTLSSLSNQSSPNNPNPQSSPNNPNPQSSPNNPNPQSSLNNPNPQSSPNNPNPQTSPPGQDLVIQNIRVDIKPLAMFILFLVLGVFGGVIIRTSDYFGINIQNEIRKWTEVGLNEKYVSQTLFANLIGGSVEDGTKSNPLSTRQGFANLSIIRPSSQSSPQLIESSKDKYENVKYCEFIAYFNYNFQSSLQYDNSSFYSGSTYREIAYALNDRRAVSSYIDSLIKRLCN
jgi:hypothetical protein